MKVLVFIESDEGKIKKSSLEAVSYAAEIAHETMAIVFGEMGGHGSCDGEMEGAKHGSSDGAEGRKVEKVDVGAKRMGQCHAVGTLTSLRVSIIWWSIGGFIFQMVADYMLI